MLDLDEVIDWLLEQEEELRQKPSVAVLAPLRDLRWSLMALRAEKEDPGDAPVFDNPQDLLVYLNPSSK
jgi:hypothetical protein